MKNKTKTMTIISLMTAMICILGPITLAIPISPVPVSFVTLAIYFAVYILGMRGGTVSCLLYLLIGFIGVPVFSAFTGGAGKLLGPTGGYLIGYVFMALISGFFIERWQNQRIMQMIGMLLGTLVCYLVGTAWLSIQAGMSFSAALAAGVLPFIPGDAVKIAAAFIAAPAVRKRLIKAGIFS